MGAWACPHAPIPAECAPSWRVPCCLSVITEGHIWSPPRHGTLSLAGQLPRQDLGQLDGGHRRLCRPRKWPCGGTGLSLPLRPLAPALCDGRADGLLLWMLQAICLRLTADDLPPSRQWRQRRTGCRQLWCHPRSSARPRRGTEAHILL